MVPAMVRGVIESPRFELAGKKRNGNLNTPASVIRIYKSFPRRYPMLLTEHIEIATSAIYIFP
jgi:hypothetical protein